MLGRRLRARIFSRILGLCRLERPYPLPGLIRAVLEQHRVYQIGDSCLDTLGKPIDGPMVDVFYQEEHLNDVGGAVQVPLVDVSLVTHTALVAVSGKQGGSHNLTRSMNGSLLSEDNNECRTYRGFLVFAGAPIHVCPDNAIGPDQPKNRCLDV
jgi:hypothetical protein